LLIAVAVALTENCNLQEPQRCILFLPIHSCQAVCHNF